MLFDIAIAILGAAAQLVGAFLGLRVTTQPPSTIRGRRAFEAGFVLAAILGLLAVGLSTIRASRAQSEVRAAQERVVTLEEKNAAVLASVKASLDGLAKYMPEVAKNRPEKTQGAGSAGAATTGAPQSAADAAITAEGTPARPEVSITEQDRRDTMVKQLRSLWIAGHDGISPEMMAGLEWPPADWMNEQLAKYGQAWRVRVSGPKYQTYDLKQASRSAR